MPEYVYALHDFIPENEDEVSFHAGERIEVVEKDDLYGDGWWKGRNLTGKVGLFPQSYTAPAPPSPAPQPAEQSQGLLLSSPTTTSAASSPNNYDTTAPNNNASSTLHPLSEESEPSLSPSSHTHTLPSSTAGASSSILAPVPTTPHQGSSLLNGNGIGNHDHEYINSPEQEEHEHDNSRDTGDSGVMKATMTDVQKAIEQLGRPRALGGDAHTERSFSFASSRGGDETDETDYDVSDVDNNEVDRDADGGWHKGARTKLAEKARRAVEEAEKLEALMSFESGGERISKPPIEVEMSDESGDEHDDEHDDNEYTHTTSSSFQHQLEPYIVEEDEDGVSDGGIANGHAREMSTATAATLVPGNGATATARSSESFAAGLDFLTEHKEEVGTVTATRTTFPPIPEPSSPMSPTAFTHSPEPMQEREASPFITVSSVSPAPTAATTTPLPFPVQSESSLAASALSPASSIHPDASALSASASSSTHPPASAISSTQPTTLSDELIKSGSGVSSSEKTHPSEWTVEQVVEWLRGKGFGDDVCEKFTEQEITGDVLLELDVNLLKTEIGIMAFGKRMRIANAITDLRRPPSISYSDHVAPSSAHSHSFASAPSYPGSAPSFAGVHTPLSMVGSMQQQQQQSQSQHSRTQSTAAQSHNSYPGSGYGHAHTYSQSVSVQSSLGGSPMAYSGGTFGFANGGGPYSGNGNGNFQDSMHSHGDAETTTGSEKKEEEVAAPVVVADVGKASKGRPSQLNLSPSDGALKSTAKAVSDIQEQAEEEDRGHMSEGEATHAPVNTSMRRKLFGRSHDSSASSQRHRDSKDASSLAPSATASPTTKDIPDKESEKDEGGKEKDRLSASSAPTVGSRHARAKKSIDGGKGSGDRLSIFGASFGGTIGKGRKPAPRVSEDGVVEKSSSMFHLPRLTHGSSVRKGSTMSQRSDASIEKERVKEPVVSEKEKEHEKEKEKEKGEKEKDKKEKDNTLRKRSPSQLNGDDAKHATGIVAGTVTSGKSILEQIGEPDHAGYMRKKGDRYNSWKVRYFVLKGPHMYCLRSNNKAETKLKGYIHIVGYKVTVDENVDPGRYGFRIDHENDKTHYFSSDEKTVIRDWMKAIMKATIGRDYSRPVMSSCNIPTISLTVAQAMNPAPRPPSPAARDATQKALRRENTDQPSSRDTRILMGLPLTEAKEERTKIDEFFANGDGTAGNTPVASKAPAPPRPSREMRRKESVRSQQSAVSVADTNLVDWANTHLPASLQITDPASSLCGGLALLRLAESIKGTPSSPPVPDSAFPVDANDDKLDGLFKLFDFLLDNDVKMGSVSINDVRLGKRDKIMQLIKALKAWEDKRKAIAQSISKSAVQVGPYMAPGSMPWATIPRALSH